MYYYYIIQLKYKAISKLLKFWSIQIEILKLIIFELITKARTNQIEYFDYTNRYSVFTIGIFTPNDM